ncbi:MAG: hypothetical protein ACXWQX_16150 [Bdellovibrio sp.]
MEQAKNVAVFFKEQSKETRLMSRKASAFVVKDCADKDETVMRLAFFAAKANFNGLIDVDISFKKVREGSYQTLKWNGSGIPVNINNKKSFR